MKDALYQTKNCSGQDPLNFPFRLNNNLANVVGQLSTGYFRPTEQVSAFKKKVTAQIDEQLKILKQVKTQDIPALNKLVKDKNINAITAKKATAKADAL